jgi:hypothetical protein
VYEFDSESDGATVVWCLVIDLGAKIGHYGSGTLSCLKTQRAIYILFNSVRIAKTGLA